MAAAYRLRQGIRALLAFSQPVDTELASRHLTSRGLALFTEMSRSEQLHSLNVLRDVLAQGITPDALAAAALLHDVGKSRYPLFIWQKTIAVLVRTISPIHFEHWSRGNPQNHWRRPFVVMTQHPAWSAELLTAAGASEVAIWLVTHHQDPLEEWISHPHYRLLERLQRADELN